jgi:hypothetical protein
MRWWIRRQNSHCGTATRVDDRGFCPWQLCEALGIRRLAPSVLREDFGPSSDIDMLVEFFPTELLGCSSSPKWN